MEEVYAYDAGNHLIKLTRNGADISFQYDRAGNLLNDDRAAYSYDVFNRQTSVETFDGNIQINHYDAEGLRHEMEENGKLVQFIFRGTEVVVEETQEENIRYIRTHELLASDAESARTYYHYASDEMGSITHVTDEEGNILNRYEYDAWGNLTAAEEQVPNRFKYTGEQFDAITQQYYLRARFYNPALARFMQEDTYRGDGLNLYAYCANNPVIYVDPSGHWCKVKQNVYERLVRENGLDINNIDPDTKQRLMAEASNQVKKEKADSSERKHTPRLPELVMTGQNRLPGPVADTPDDGGRGNGGSGTEEREPVKTDSNLQKIIDGLKTADIIYKANPETGKKEPYMKQYQVNDEYKVIFRRDFGAFNHDDPAGNHWNFEIQTTGGRTVYDVHVYVDDAGNLLPFTKDNIYIPKKSPFNK